jgi:hypothetical protein
MHVLPDFDGIDPRTVSALAAELIAMARDPQSALRARPTGTLLAGGELYGAQTNCAGSLASKQRAQLEEDGAWRKVDEARAAEEARIAEEEARALEEARIAEEEARALKEARIAEEEARALEEARIAEEEARALEEARIAEEARASEEARIEEEARALEEARIAEEEARAFEASRIAEEEARALEEARIAEEAMLAEKEAIAAAEQARVAELVTAGKEASDAGTAQVEEEEEEEEEEEIVCDLNPSLLEEERVKPDGDASQAAAQAGHAPGAHPALSDSQAPEEDGLYSPGGVRATAAAPTPPPRSNFFAQQARPSPAASAAAAQTPPRFAVFAGSNAFAQARAALASPASPAAAPPPDASPAVLPAAAPPPPRGARASGDGARAARRGAAAAAATPPRVEVFRVVQQPDRIPVLLAKREASIAPDVSAPNFLVPREITLRNLARAVGRRMDMPPGCAVALFAAGRPLPASDGPLGAVARAHCSADGALRLEYDISNGAEAEGGGGSPGGGRSGLETVRLIDTDVTLDALVPDEASRPAREHWLAPPDKPPAPIAPPAAMTPPGRGQRPEAGACAGGVGGWISLGQNGEASAPRHEPPLWPPRPPVPCGCSRQARLRSRRLLGRCGGTSLPRARCRQRRAGRRTRSLHRSPR